MGQTERAVQILRALAEPVRFEILHRLMEGPVSVSEMVSVIGTSQPNVSNHLAVLRGRGLVSAEQVGRRSIYRLESSTVASLIESLAALASTGSVARPSSELAASRTCYDHIAGRLGVQILDALVAKHALEEADPGRGDLGLASGRALLERLGIELDTVGRKRRRFAFACLDWTEKRAHLGGALGAALCTSMIEQAWIVRRPETRAITVTATGRKQFRRVLGIRC